MQLLILQVLLGMALAMPGGSRSDQGQLIRLVQVSDDVTRSSSGYGSSARSGDVIRAVLVQADEDEGDFERARYRFAYAVDDHKSGDNKHRQEIAEDGVITGFYTVEDADGRLRRVDYSASRDTGFVAKVTYDGQEGPVVVPTTSNRNTNNNNNDLVLVDDVFDDDDSVIVSRINLDDNISFDDVDTRTFEVASSVPVVDGRSGVRRGSSGSRGSVSRSNLGRSSSARGAQLIRLADGRTLAIVADDDNDDNVSVVRSSNNNRSNNGQVFRLVRTNSNDH